MFNLKNQKSMKKLLCVLLALTTLSLSAQNDQLPDDATLAACLRTVRKVAEMEGLLESGFRTISNCGPHACQSVRHLHFHVLGGKQLSEKMD